MSTGNDIERLMKRLQAGTTNYNAANDLHAECYGTIGKMQGEIERLRNERGDLSLLVVRLMRRMRAARNGQGLAAGDSALEQQATDYLRRTFLLPSPLRGDEQ